ncbi:hypothetical protein CUJ83_04505 [Methanocella sp. CWC-04]|uniref:Uncharacterized protein n=1 Tax=Methanooceanicella nereidis TaxID=2052831 RepID=A0AAP2RDJ1_9EURY|nr:hypothetical protein [Methanocella sp. CWC-04]MCD1294257.1 hypothetical protein [Methanocella sp. CWC-04]
MAGVGRKSDFGKSMYDTEVDVENRLDTTDPLVDENIPYEKRVKNLMDRGMTRKQAEEWIEHAREDVKAREKRKEDIIYEQSAYRKQIGDLKYCTPIDESCVPTENYEKKEYKKM